MTTHAPKRSTSASKGVRRCFVEMGPCKPGYPNVATRSTRPIPLTLPCFGHAPASRGPIPPNKPLRHPLFNREVGRCKNRRALLSQYRRSGRSQPGGTDHGIRDVLSERPQLASSGVCGLVEGSYASLAGRGEGYVVMSINPAPSPEPEPEPVSDRSTKPRARGLRRAPQLGRWPEFPDRTS